MAVSVVVVEDHEVVRAGLRAWFADAGIQVVAEAADAQTGERAVLAASPDVVLLDVSLPGIDGLDCLTRLRDQGYAGVVLVLSDQENPTYAARASALRAVGFLPKSIRRAELIDAVLRAADGQDLWSAPTVRRMTGSMATPQSAPAPAGLTSREVEVLKQLSFGLSNKEIAQALGISYETVKEHVQHVLRKLGVADRTQAAVWAVRNGVA